MMLGGWGGNGAGLAESIYCSLTLGLWLRSPAQDRISSGTLRSYEFELSVPLSLYGPQYTSVNKMF